jgi:heme oxygenase
MSSDKIIFSVNAEGTDFNSAGLRAPEYVSLVQELRQKSALRHRAVEKKLDIAGCFVSRDAYGELLLKFAGIYANLEGKLAAVKDLALWLPDISTRWKSPFLRDDLAALSVTQPHARLTSPPQIQSVASAFGCLYVLEGSTLGGQILSRQILDQLGFTPEYGCQFFSSYGPRVYEMWKIFGQKAEAFCLANEKDRTEILESAAKTFDCFLQ